MDFAMRTIILLLLGVQLALGALVFEDTFDGWNANLDNWNVNVVPSSHNDELQYYTANSENVRIEDGHLVISPLRQYYGSKQYTSGKLTSKSYWKYGRFEVRAKLPDGYGLWPAIWMMPEFSVYGGWPASGEIDIVEARGQYLDQIQSTVHYGHEPCCDQHYYDSSGNVQLDCSIAQYHVYTFDWTSTTLTYSIDNIVYFSQNIEAVTGWTYQYPGQPFDQYFYLILNVAVGGNYVNDPSSSTYWNYPDAEMWVDYVRVYDTAGSGGGTGQGTGTYECVAKSSASYSDVCDAAMWACDDQNYANVDAECTAELRKCCSIQNCDEDHVKDLASAVFTAYDSQLNSDTSCDFGGTAERVEVTDTDSGGSTNTGGPKCVIKDSASKQDICGALQWACYDNYYADVSQECNRCTVSLACCNVGAITCDEDNLREQADTVFQAYYDAIPSSTACDFGGVCELQYTSRFGASRGLSCTDGYGG